MKTAIELIADERNRQIAKGFNAEHDDQHVLGEIAGAAATYALSGCGFRAPHKINGIRRIGATVCIWPFDESAWKPTSRITDLVKAGAMIVAEIERMQRKGSR